MIGIILKHNQSIINFFMDTNGIACLFIDTI